MAFGKKTVETVHWRSEDSLRNLPVSFIIKKAILTNSRSQGTIYIQNDRFDYGYGNLCEIIPHNTLDQIAESVQIARRSDGAILWNIQF